MQYKEKENQKRPNRKYRFNFIDSKITICIWWDCPFKLNSFSYFNGRRPIQKKNWGKYLHKYSPIDINQDPS